MVRSDVREAAAGTQTAAGAAVGGGEVAAAQVAAGGLSPNREETLRPLRYVCVNMLISAGNGNCCDALGGWASACHCDCLVLVLAVIA